MDLDFITMWIFFWFMVIPALVFDRMGLDYEQMSAFPFIFFWVLLIWLLVKLFNGLKYLIRLVNKKHLVLRV